MRKSAPNLQPFFTDLPQRMAEAHLVIARSGAGTVAELMAIGRPAILVPLPACAGRQPDAQCGNPLESRCGLVRAASAMLSPDALAADARQDFRRSRSIWPSARPRAHALATPDAAGKLADMVDELARSSARRGRMMARKRTAVTTRVPLDIGAIHFIGIGGIGMSGIAEIMHNLGYKVQGSRRGRERQCQTPARHGHHHRMSATTPKI